MKNNYEEMVQINQMKKEDMINRTLSLISDMLENDEEVTIAKLKRKTGRSRDYFYKNKTVHEAILKAQSLQSGKVFVDKKEDIICKSLMRENTLLKRRIVELNAEITILNDKLSKQKSLEFDFINQL